MKSIAIDVCTSILLYFGISLCFAFIVVEISRRITPMELIDIFHLLTAITPGIFSILYTIYLLTLIRRIRLLYQAISRTGKSFSTLAQACFGYNMYIIKPIDQWNADNFDHLLRKAKQRFFPFGIL